MPRRPKPPDLPGLCSPSDALRSGGRIAIGGVLGKAGDKSVLSVGRLRTSGPERIELGVVPGERQWYVARNGKLFRYAERGKPPGPAYPPQDPRELEEDSRGVWADTLAREFIDAHTSTAVAKFVPAMIKRYHKMVAAYLNGAMVDCALANVERNIDDFTRACSNDWGKRELTHGSPTIRHAITIALALQLPVDQAAMLVEMAGFIEFRMPIVQRETAAMLYQEAARMLSYLMPVWNMRGAKTDWRALGTSVEDLFARQFVRMANDADARALSADIITGMREAVTQVGESPLGWRYLDRSAAPMDLEETAKNLGDYDIKRPQLDSEDLKL